MTQLRSLVSWLTEISLVDREGANKVFFKINSLEIFASPVQVTGYLIVTIGIQNSIFSLFHMIYQIFLRKGHMIGSS